MRQHQTKNSIVLLAILFLPRLGVHGAQDIDLVTFPGTLNAVIAISGLPRNIEGAVWGRRHLRVSHLEFVATVWVRQILFRGQEIEGANFSRQDVRSCGKDLGKKSSCPNRR